MLDSCGISGTGETPQERKRRGGSPPAPRKASILERKLTHSFSNNVYMINNDSHSIMKVF
ncbi:hypothetical protein Q9251_07170 [Alkalihalobacillus macyae]|nr:hypothetical protein [Alkalihalobacillus macyae]MDP4550660.1 hypothetical protein [Alkalihalobacillus macyae]